MSTLITKALQTKNAAYAASFKDGDKPLPPAKKYLVLTCMDARIVPSEAFGIALGDAHVVRNAGGMAKDALRSIIISQQLLGTTEVVVVKHTGCGMLTFTNKAAHAVVADQLGGAAADDIAALDFMPFPDLEQAVKDDVEFLRCQPTIPRHLINITGWVYEVETGRVRKVDTA